MKTTDRRLAIMAGIAALVLLAGGVGFYLFQQSRDTTRDYEFTGGSWEPPHQATDLALTDQNGQPFSLEDHRGKVILLYFGYTYCPDYCPTTLSDFMQVKQDLGERANDVEVVFVSVDPERDTTARLKEYLAFFDPAFIGLTGTEDQLKPIERDYGIQVAREAATPSASGDAFYLVSHSTSLFAIDQDGNLRLTWAYGTSPADIAADVTHLLDAPADS
ncbi:MAG: SCO family protein [Thermomicrobiales bacterium]